MAVRRPLVLAVVLAPLALAGWLFLYERDGGERVRFALYRPGTAQFLLGRDVARGGSLDRAHDASEVVPFGAPGDIGLACPQPNRDNRNGLRTFADGAWFLSAERARSRAADERLGQRDDVPFCADFDGDGIADVGVFRAGMWYIATKRGGGPDVRYSFGAPGDRPVVLNVDGAGNSTDRRNVVYGVYRRGMWFLDPKGTGTVGAAHAFGGLPQDVPLLVPRWSRAAATGPAYSLAIFRDGTWHVKPDPDGTQTLSFSFGAPGDQPGFVR